MQYQFNFKSIPEEEQNIFFESELSIDLCKKRLYEILYHHYVDIDQYCGIDDFNIDDLFEAWEDVTQIKSFDQDTQLYYLDLLRQIDNMKHETKVSRLFHMLSLTRLFLNYPNTTMYLEDKLLLLAKVYEKTPTINFEISKSIIEDTNYYDKIIQDETLGHTGYDRILNQKLILEDNYAFTLEKEIN